MYYTDAQLIEQYLKLRTLSNEKVAAHKKEIEPIAKAMSIIENVFLTRFTERGSDSSKTDFGTAYTSSGVSLKVVDGLKFLDHCVKTWNEGGADRLNIKPYLDPVREFMAAHDGAPPPGLEKQEYTSVNIRKA